MRRRKTAQRAELKARSEARDNPDAEKTGAKKLVRKPVVRVTKPRANNKTRAKK